MDRDLVQYLYVHFTDSVHGINELYHVPPTGPDLSHIKNNISQHIRHSDSCSDELRCCLFKVVHKENNCLFYYIQHALLQHGANALLDTAKTTYFNVQ